MATTKPTHSQTRVPNAPPPPRLDSSKHYVIIEDDSPYNPTYKSPYHKYMSKRSLTGSGAMYEDLGQVDGMISDNTQRVLACSMADHQAFLRQMAADAKAAEGNTSDSDGYKLTKQAPRSLSELNVVED